MPPERAARLSYVPLVNAADIVPQIVEVVTLGLGCGWAAGGQVVCGTIMQKNLAPQERG
jgi:hypothetical protein